MKCHQVLYHIDIPLKAPGHPNNKLPKDGTALNPVQNGVFKLLHGWFWDEFKVIELSSDYSYIYISWVSNLPSLGEPEFQLPYPNKQALRWVYDVFIYQHINLPHFLVFLLFVTVLQTYRRLRSIKMTKRASSSNESKLW